MSVQFRTSTYTEEFRCPPRGKPARPRPCSAHRRNNPHPRPDFLFPRRLQTGYGAWQTAPAQTSLHYGSRLFPPLRHVSFPCQAEGRPPSLLLRPSSRDRPATHQPALSFAHRCLSPSTGQLCKPEPVDSTLRDRQFQNSPKYTDCDIQPHIGQGNRGISGSDILKEPISKRPENTTFSRHPKPQMYFTKARSTLDPRGGLDFCKRSSSLGVIQGGQREGVRKKL
ncbi:hypothetical protein COCON_G00165340 [Conger conger]|uniref:Uncharacterized protein n=1 Tax=Conger conger TaxID=82655 RepID=A0A9Q1HTR7_CONCO|nr:hypothetical protein COCON_G00165340 [Conger conger]